MKKAEFEQYVDVFRYVYDKDYEDIEYTNLDVLRIGLLGLSALTGEAQELIKSAMPKKMTDVQKEFWDHFVNAENTYEGNSWITKAPVSISGAFTSNYADPFYSLLKKSIPTQKLKLEELFITSEQHCALLKLTEPSHKALYFCRMILDPVTNRDLESLIFLSRKSLASLLETIAVDARSGSLLSDRTRKLPGKDLNPWKEFPWLKIAPKEEETNGNEIQS